MTVQKYHVPCCAASDSFSSRLTAPRLAVIQTSVLVEILCFNHTTWVVVEGLLWISLWFAGRETAVVSWAD